MTEQNKSQPHMPRGASAAPGLRAMATNYPAGHSWDKLDAQTCLRGALEIEALRATKEGDVFRALIAFLMQAEEPMAFLHCWNEGNFDACREDWPEAPEALYPTTPPVMQAPAPVPDDFHTHKFSWRNAIDTLRKTAQDPDKGYWARELRAFDRAYEELARATHNTPPTEQPQEK